MSKYVKNIDKLNTYLESGIDLERRIISFGHYGLVEHNDFSSTNVQTAIRAIDIMLHISNKPIELHFSSYGGDVYEMFSLIDKILESPCKFVFYGRGAIMSAASAIMVVCDERWISHNSKVMIHDGSTGYSGTTTELDIENEENQQLQGDLEAIYEDNSFVDKLFWRSICRRNVYLRAKEVVELGLADAILPHKKRGNLRKGPRENTFNRKPNEEKIKKLLQNIYKRIRIDLPTEIKITTKKDTYEDIVEYDNSDKLLDNLLNKTEINEPL